MLNGRQIGIPFYKGQYDFITSKKIHKVPNNGKRSKIMAIVQRPLNQEETWMPMLIVKTQILFLQENEDNNTTFTRFSWGLNTK